MNENTTMAVRKDIAQRLKRLKPKNMFVPNGLLFAKLLARMTDEQVLDLIKEVHEERDLLKYNYTKPEPKPKPQQFIYSDPLAQ